MSQKNKREFAVSAKDSFQQSYRNFILRTLCPGSKTDPIMYSMTKYLA